MSQIQIPSMPGAVTPAPQATPAARPVERVRKVEGPDKQGWYRGTGRRKTAVSRVRLKPVAGSGEGSVLVRVSGKRTRTVEEYFSEERDRADVYAPLRTVGLMGKVDVIARLNGGGYMGQAQAMRLGIARALRNLDVNLEGALREQGFLTRDAREVERKKYGQAGARRRFQFSKR